MKIKNRDILRFANSMFGSKHWPVKLAFTISVNSEAMVPAIKAFDESRKKLAEEYSKKDKDDKPIIENDQYKIKDIEKFNEAYRELEDMEVEVNITPVEMEEVAKCETPEFDSITVSEIAALKFMIKASS